MAYKLLQNKAIQGDSVAMMSMSDMNLSEKISDPGELHRAYWLFQASKVNAQAVGKLRDECQRSVDKRLTDQLFNSACATTDGRIDYLGNRLTRQTNPFLPDYATPKK